MANKIQIRRDTGANWTAANPTLAQGELGIVTDAVPVQFKVGDGTTAWNSLGYVASGSMDVASSTLDDLVDGTTYARTLAAIAAALNASTIVAGTQWGSGNDGNGGQPPAPKATILSELKAQNEYISITVPAGTGYYIAVAHNASQSNAVAVAFVASNTGGGYVTSIVTHGECEISSNGFDIRFVNKNSESSLIKALLFRVGW